MNRPLIVRPAAETDIREIHDYLEAAQSGLGTHFAARLREVFERVETMPESCATIWQDVRATRVKKFQYIVYYVSFEDRTEVLAVLHSARHEAAWQARQDG
jgi:plasmid stabilization system protein ParE